MGVFSKKEDGSWSVMSLFIVWSKRVDVEKIEGIFGGKGSKI